MTEVTAKKVILKDKNGQYLIPYTDNSGGGGFEVGDIGIAPLGIDESKGLRRYLNGSTLNANANTQAFIDKLKTAAASYPSLVCTETEWQAIASSSVGGQCGKFVINYGTDGTTVISVRLPKIIMPIQGLTDLTKLGELVKAGLPNITGSTNVWSNVNVSSSGALNIPLSSNRGETVNGSAQQYANLNFDASQSNSIYSDDVNTVQQEQIQYPYFIQIATGQETEVNITNEIELNNPYTLFDSKYSEALLYNASWLKSDGTFYAKSVYVTAYEALVVENNTEVEAGDSVTLPSGTTYVKRGLSVKLSIADDITDYDFIINTTDETFRLPLKTKLASGNQVMGTGVAIGITDGTTNYGIRNGSHSNVWGFSYLQSGVYGTKVGEVHASGSVPNGNKSVGITTDPNKSGMMLSDNNLYLYFYIGETVQNANLINAGRVLENALNKSSVKAYITETYVNGQSGYRIWSDGLLEQWGRQSVGNRSTSNIVFLKSFKNANYLALITSITGTNSTASNSNRGALRDLTTTQMTLQQAEGGYTYSWYTMGY